MADHVGRAARPRPRAARLACPLLLLSLALGAPLTPEKLELLPVAPPRERRELFQKLAPVLGDEAAVRELLRAAAVDAAVVDNILCADSGPLLAERCAHALVPLCDSLTPLQQALFRILVPATDAAQLALDLRRRSVAQDLQFPPEDPRCLQVAEVLGRQIREIENRFWRVAGYALDRDQRIQLRRRLPLAHQPVPDLLGHVYLLRDLTPAQAGQVESLAAEFASETAAEEAEARRLEKASPPEPAKLAEVRDRLADRLLLAFARGRTIFTPEQAAELDAIAPLLSPADRKRHPGEIVAKLDLTPEQRAILGGLGGAIELRVEAARRRAQESKAPMEGEVGAEAPQSRMMRLADQGVEAEMVGAFEELGREAVLRILRPDQLASWVSGS